MNYVEPGYVRSGYVRLDSDTQGGFTFDGHGRFIVVDPSVAAFDVAEMYSRWKDWVQQTIPQDGSAKWLPAMRYSGSDPIPGGTTGAVFFMSNGWRVKYDPNATAVTGVLFSETYATAYWTNELAPVYPVTVSAVVNNVTTTQNVVTGDLASLPNADQVATQVRAELAAELLRIMELAKIHGLVAGQPLTVAPAQRQAGDVVQSISEAGGVVTVARNP
jgi:hypothetical protein